MFEVYIIKLVLTNYGKALFIATMLVLTNKGNVPNRTGSTHSRQKLKNFVKGWRKERMLPLNFARQGVASKIVKTSVNDEKLRRHLEDRGIIKGQEITLLSSTGGNIIVKVKDGSLALNKELALRIYVEGG